MKETPILMCSAMVRATLGGRKTQTRRIVWPQPNTMPDGFCWEGGKSLLAAGYGAPYLHSNWTSVEKAMLAVCPWGGHGDRLWVRETWRCDDVEPPPGNYTERIRLTYRADGEKRWFEKGEWQNGVRLDPERWTPGIHMFKWTARLWLELTAVRVERVQDIPLADCAAEGAHPTHLKDNVWDSTDTYRKLWDRLNAERHGGQVAWACNPWVWVLTFKVVPKEQA